MFLCDRTEPCTCGDDKSCPLFSCDFALPPWAVIFVLEMETQLSSFEKGEKLMDILILRFVISLCFQCAVDSQDEVRGKAIRLVLFLELLNFS